MAEEPDFLDQDRRQTVLNTIVEVLQYRGWHLWAAHVRSNHVHLAVAAEQKPEKVMSDVKAWCSRRLRERHGEPADRTRWTQHGSTKYLMTEEEFHAAVRYILQFQGEPMAVACDPAIEYLGTADAVVPDGSRKR